MEPDRVVLIDDAVDLALFDPGQSDPDFIASRFGIAGSPVIGLVGRISPFKRIHEFLEIVGLLPLPVRNSARFIIIGQWDDRSYRHEIERTVERLQLGGRVFFPGRCPSELMPQLLSSLDLLATLSGGSVMFEAMAMGKPVLSIRADGRHSVHTRHNESAWNVDGSDLAAAAHALAHLIGDKALRDRLGWAGREWVVKNLSREAMIAKIERVYENLAR
jgi:glycosyltransferase involved in cell wall biosynthesis